MASVADTASPTGITGFFQSQLGRTLGLLLGIALVVGVMVGVGLWSQKPEYKVLFANYSDRDGGAITASLSQMNVPYKFAEGGSAILVPADMVYDARLKLASQGLPKGGNVGFELMENQKLGVSQFHEQVNFQRALEGELATSIQSLAAVQSARVHLALPKASVFVRDQQKPTASVILNLFPGRTLESKQVSGIVHLVASSVPDLPTGNVSILDQSGNLLSDSNKPSTGLDLDATQLKYIREIQQGIVARIESIVTPIVGNGNVRAEATAEVDFSRTEQAAETYKPNGTPTEATIRSQYTSESQNGGTAASGVPGALSNQPPAPASAPLTAPAAPGAGTPPGQPVKVQKDSTTNYEVDKTIKYVQQPMGGIKRLSVAVVVNYKKEVDKTGKVTMRALTEAEKTQLNELIRDAMGFNKERGDSLNLLNTPFAGVEKEVFPELPLWKQPENIELAKEVGKYALAAIVLLYLFFGWLRPLKKRLLTPPVVAAPKEEEEEAESDDAVVALQSTGAQGQATANGPAQSPKASYEGKLQNAKELAKSDPKVVANVVKTWVNGNE